MTRFLYIADTHWGADPMGYQQQRGYPDKLPEILSALSAWIAARGDIDFILHGGDMIDATSDDTITAAASAFDLGIPVYLCLGNHDVTTPNAVERWVTLAPQLFPNGTPDSTIASDDCVLHVAPTQWCEVPYYWDRAQQPYLTPAQMTRLRGALKTQTDVPHLLLTHSPVYGLPVVQTGFAEPYHAPTAAFAAQIRDLAARHGTLKGVLGAHNHMTMRVRRAGVEFVTVSALVETPFEFKLFEVTPRRIAMATFSLSGALTFKGDYDAARSFVQGRGIDRSFSRAFGGCQNDDRL